MRGLILAAGRGSRMGQATVSQPKCLTVLDGKPLLQWQLEAMQAAGVDECGIVVGYRGEMIVAPGVARFENSRWASTNMVASLLCAAEWMRPGECIVSYSDIVYRPDILHQLRQADDPLAITADRDWLRLWSLRFEDPLRDAESFRTSTEGFVTDIGRKVRDYAEIQAQYMGLLKFTAGGWRDVEAYLTGLGPDRTDSMDMTTLLQSLISAGHPIRAVFVHGGWCEVDNEQDLAAYERLAATQGGLLRS